MPSGNINQSPIVPVLNALHLNWLLTRYVDDCRSRLHHQVTVDGYAYQLRWFVEWWSARGPTQDWLLSAPDFAAFERHLRGAHSPRTQRPLSYHSRLTILKRLKEALKWALQHGYVERDYTQWIPQAEGGPPKRRAAPIAMLHKLLDTAANDAERAMLAILMGMGLRRAEVAALNVEDLVVEADYSGYARVVGKRTKANRSGERDAAFDSATGALIVAHLDSCGRIRGPLFTGKRGRLGGQGVYKRVKRLIRQAGLEGHIIGPHDLRRAFATHYRRNRAASADLLRRQLGHASLSMTDEYTLLDVNDIRADLVSPLALFASR